MKNPYLRAIQGVNEFMVRNEKSVINFAMSK